MRRFPFKHSIIVSCQALKKNEPLYGSEIMKRMAVAAIQGGAKGIRANSPEDVKAIRSITDLPIIGIQKSEASDGEAFITTRKSDIRRLIEAGADMIAIGCTRTFHPELLGELFGFIRKSYPNVSIVADIADKEDARRIANLIISTTLSGYTSYTKDRAQPDVLLIKEIRKATVIPVLAEGNYQTPEQVRKAILSGAYAIVIGSAITKPHLIIRRFVDFIKDLKMKNFSAIGIDVDEKCIKGIRLNRYGMVERRKMVLINIGRIIETSIIISGYIAKSFKGIDGKMGYIEYPVYSKDPEDDMGYPEDFIKFGPSKETNKKTIDKIANNIAWLITTIIHIMAPEKIYLSGVNSIYRMLLEKIRSKVDLISNFRIPPDIINWADLNDYSGAMGAALLSLNKNARMLASSNSLFKGGVFK